MERSKIIISIFVGFAAIFIVWRVGFYPPVPEQAEKAGEAKVVGQAGPTSGIQEPGDANRPVVASDVNAPGDANEPRRFADARGRRGFEGRPGQTEGGDFRRAGRVTDVNDANEPMENLNLKEMQMRDIIRKIAEWTGKTVIPNDEAMKQKLTVYAPNPLPRNKALQQIYSALRIKGYIVERMDDTIYIKPIAEGKFGLVPTIPADQPLATIEDKNQMAQKFFKLTNYNPSQMGQVIQPLVGEYGYVSADETTGSVLVIDTVANLIRIERIILELDVSQAEKIEQEVFEILYGNPEEIVELLQVLVGDGSGSTTQGRGGGSFRRPQRSDRPGGSSGATSVTVGSGQAQVTLIADTRNSLIIAKASSENMEQIRQWIKKLDKSVPTITAEYPLAAIENKNQMMQYFFRLQNYSPTQMAQVVTPLLSENGYVSADESTRQLLVGDMVKNLIDIERVIKQFDVPEAEQTVQDIFEIRNGDPGEIVQLLRMLLGDTSTSGTSSRSLTRSSGYGSSSSRYSSSRSGYTSSSGGRTGSTSSVIIGPSQSPVILIPVPNRKWIIARASAEDMKRIEEWINKLDVQEEVKKEYETIPITYVDVSEVAERINEALEEMPGTELRASVLVQPLEQARQIMVFGRQDLREMVRTLVSEVDRPPGQFITEHFKLKYADPDQIKTNIDELYTQTTQTSRYSYTYYFGSSRSTTSPDTVKVISYISLKQVTVIASPENMDKIREQIKEWDAPLDINEVKPRIVELYNSDPVQMATLLRTLFSEESGSSSMSLYEFLYGYSAGGDKQKIVGPLYGQLTFEEVPNTKKIIVISKIPEAYAIVEALIRDLDRQEMAEVPRIVQLKYADPEDLAERLNAMFNEPGTNAVIRYTAQGLGTYSMESQTSSSQSSSGQTSNQSSSGSQNQSSQSGTYTPWWSGSGARTSTASDQLPISNVIGRIRFVPDPHSKSILVLAPPGHIDRIEELIRELDIPGKQVMVKAVIIEIDHKSMTSLGLQLASNSSAFGTLGENSLTLGAGETAAGVLQLLEKHGALVFGAGGDQGSSLALDVAMDVTALVDFLVKKVNAKILNQQTLWTKDNEEASFFKGDRVAFLTASTLTGTGTAQQSFEFQKVGMTMAVRPSITPEKRVDMVINIILSQLTGDLVNSQPARTEMETKTNMIVEDGQTIMLGGILFQKDSVIKRKIPLFGDIPVAGGLFRHNETMLANNELIVFITPYVIDEPIELPETTEEIEAPRRKLEDVRGELKSTMEKLKEELEKE
jgi:general secretion pathway protein D